MATRKTLSIGLFLLALASVACGGADPGSSKKGGSDVERPTNGRDPMSMDGEGANPCGHGAALTVDQYVTAVVNGQALTVAIPMPAECDPNWIDMGDPSPESVGPVQDRVNPIVQKQQISIRASSR